MKLETDKFAFDDCQNTFISAISEATKHFVGQTSLGPDEQREVTLKVVFEIASLLDACSDLNTFEGRTVQPYLTFRQGDNLLHANEGSWMHEYAVDAVEQLFED